VKLSAVILTKNEESNILDCLESLSFADEIIIVDDNSEDRTDEVIKNLKDKRIKLYKRSLEYDFSKQRNFGLDKSKNEWVIFVDADERVPKSLASELLSLEDRLSEGVDAFSIKRLDVMWGKELRYGETGNIKLVRLAKKSVGAWDGAVHEVWNVEGNIGELNNPLIHYPHPTVREFIAEISTYSTIRANELHRDKITVNAIQIILYPKAKFILNYFLKLGFLDGVQGMVVALMMSFHSFLVRSKLWLLNNS